MDSNEPSENWAQWLDSELGRPAGSVAPGKEPARAVGTASTKAADVGTTHPKLEFQEALAPPNDGSDVTDPRGIPDPERPPVRAAAALAGPSVPAARPKRKRVSRWDRPKEPRDWRWVVGHIGRALITLGLLMFGFVAYQLWGTGIQTARAQDHLKNEFEDKLAALPFTPDTIVPASSVTTTVPPTTIAGSPATTPVATTVPATTIPAGPVQQDYGLVKDGDGLGKITIPRIDVNFYYIAGVSKADLDRGVGHFPKSVLPGQYGNAALAGHRTSHLAPFGDLDVLEPGDEIDIETILGGAYVYIVTGSEVVEPSDYHVVTDSDPNVATLTLITCTPKFTSKQRLVIHATIDPTRSGSALGIGEVYYGEATPDASLGGDGTLPDDDGLGNEATTAVPTTVAPTTVAPAAVDPAAVDPSTTVAGVVAPVGIDPTATTLLTETTVLDTTTTAPVAATTTTNTTVAGDQAATADSVNVVAEFADDAFDQGWFDDGAAWPHVIGWAALFGLVWFACYRLAKRFRNLWIGIAVAIAPVVVVLYFLYENVNRLLPAAI